MYSSSHLHSVHCALTCVQTTTSAEPSLALTCFREQASDGKQLTCLRPNRPCTGPDLGATDDERSRRLGFDLLPQTSGRWQASELPALNERCAGRRRTDSPRGRRRESGGTAAAVRRPPT